MGQYERSIGQFTGRDLQCLQLQPVHQEVQTLGIEGGGQKLDAERLAMGDQTKMGIERKLEAGEHGKLVLFLAGVGGLISGLLGLAGHQIGRLEGLKLDDIDACLVGGIDQRHGECFVAIMVDAGLGDDADHGDGLLLRSWNCLMVGAEKCFRHATIWLLAFPAP
ncbi:hypothetical protein D3C86_1662960 [compost metagenome]